MTLTNSLHRLNQFVKHLSFSSKLFKLWKFEVDQFISSIESVWEKVEIFRQTISAVKVFIFSKLLHRRNWFPRLFSCKVLKPKKVEKIYFFMYLSGHIKLYFFRKTTRALKLWTIWIHFLDWNGSPNNQFLSKLIDLWNFKVFHFMF